MRGGGGMIYQARTIRELAGVHKRKPAKIITITSGKGGVGKSSLALNMAVSLNRKGRRALIIDSDFGFSNIDVMLGVNTRHDLLDVLQKRMDIREIIEEGLEGVQFISGGSGVYELTKLSEEQIMDMVGSISCLEDMADTIIFDTGAGVSDNILRLIYASNETIIVTTPEPTALVDAYALIKIINEKVEDPAISLVLNKAASPREALAVADGVIRMAKRNLDLNIRNLGYIMRDDSMQKAVKMQVPVLVSYPGCTASENIDSLSERLLKRNMETAGSKKQGIFGFLGRLGEKIYAAE
jgi:flagellar biosynthesis protein FlhG